jgi:hypothetical protein
LSKASNAAAGLDTPSSPSAAGVNAISAALNVLLADAFALYLKTKNFHWHVSGRHFRDYHLMLDKQAEATLRQTENFSMASSRQTIPAPGTSVGMACPLLNVRSIGVPKHPILRACSAFNPRERSQSPSRSGTKAS